ncbi:MAG: MFS transporter [Actinomycetales bacterium]
MGAAAAAIGNVVFGRLSDRTASRWGRRRPWIVSGTIVMTIGFFVMAQAGSIATTTVGWFVAQLGANAAFAPFVATLADQVPQFQRGRLAAWLGIAQNAGILGGTWVAERFQDQMLIMFVGPAIIAIAIMGLYAFILPDQVLPAKPPAMSLREWGRTFWVSPREHPDFGLAWISRFLIVLGTFMFTTYRLYFLMGELDLSQQRATSVITMSVLIYTIALVATAWLAGKLSDMMGRRKIFVGVSSAMFGIGTILLAHVSSVGQFYALEALLGAAYGVYVGVDLALVVDVLPNPDDSGKDLGVFNLANAVPQTLAPVLAGILVSIGSVTNENYSLMLYVAGASAILGALAIVPIRSVR